jgi:serine phosphatase RsbU (regulator of sigma subunit)
MKNLFATFFLLLLSQCLAFSQDKVIFLNNDKKIISIGTSVAFLEDKEGKLTIEQILQPNYQQKFKLSEQEVPNFTNTNSTIWAKFTIDNSLKTKWLLEIASPLLSQIDFYYMGKKGYEVQKVGSFLPFSNRNIKTNQYLFELTTETDTTHIKTFYVSVNSVHPLAMPMKIGTPIAFMEKYHENDLGYGIYFGIMIVMALYNLFVFFTLRDKTYLYYVCYVLSVTIVYGADKGYAYEFLWKDYETLNFYFPSFAVSISIFIIFFTTSFLQTSIYTPRLHKGFYVWAILWIICLIINLVGNYAISIGLVQLFSLLFFLYLFIVAVFNVIAKNRVARYYLIAWSFYILAMVIFFLYLANILPSNAFTSNAIFFGSAIEVILLSFALADKINILKTEKVKSDKQLLQTLQANEKLILEQNQVLEAKVKERTEDLEEANEELETSYQNISVLSEIGKQVTSTLDIKTIIHIVYDNVNLLMSAEMFGIGIYNEQTKLLEFDGFMKHGLELPFYTESLSENRLSVRCFLTQHEIIVHQASQEVSNYQLEIGDMTESMLYLPLIYQNRALGIITVQSLQPHAYTNYHITMFKNIASYTTSALDNALSYRYIEDQHLIIEGKNKDIMASINYAKRIQTAILPTNMALNELLGKDNYFVLFKPRDIVSGDFYWCKEVNGKIIIAVADCTGHGVPGAFVSMIGNATLNEITKRLSHTHLILTKLHKEISHFFKQNTNTKTDDHAITKDFRVQDGMDIAIIAIDKINNKIEYSGAKNQLYHVVNNQIHEYKANKYAIGGHQGDEKERLFIKHEINYSSNEINTFYLATDGYQDQFGGEKDRKFMTKQFRELLFSISHLPMSEQQQILNKTIIDWIANKKQTDDITVMGIIVR